MKTKDNSHIMKAMKVALIGLIAGAFLISCNMKPPGTEEANAATVPEVKTRPVKTMILEYKETAIHQWTSSTVVAYEETYLSPALQGRIRKVMVEVNDHVEKGQLLVELDRTQLEQTRLQYEQLRVDLARMDTLLKTGSVTQQSYDQLKAQVESTEVVLQNLEENTLLRAPYSGVITGKYYNDGELFSPTPNTPVGKAALVSLIQVDPVKVMVNLSEKYLPLVKEGMMTTVSTDVYPGQEFNGTVFRIHPTINPASRTFTVEVKIPNRHHKLAPGMFARVGLKMGMTEALIVPAFSVLQQRGTNQRYVMLNENGKARKVVVEINSRHDDKLEIASPEIEGGEELIIAGQSNLENGNPIQVVGD